MEKSPTKSSAVIRSDENVDSSSSAADIASKSKLSPLAAPFFPREVPSASTPLVKQNETWPSPPSSSIENDAADPPLALDLLPGEHIHPTQPFLNMLGFWTQPGPRFPSSARPPGPPYFFLPPAPPHPSSQGNFPHLTPSTTRNEPSSQTPWLPYRKVKTSTGRYYCMKY